MARLVVSGCAASVLAGCSSMVLEPASPQFRDSANAALAVVGNPAQPRLAATCAEKFVSRNYRKDAAIQRDWKIKSPVVPWLPDSTSVWMQANGHADIARYIVGYRGEISGPNLVGLPTSTHFTCWFAVRDGKAAFVATGGPQLNVSNEELVADLRRALDL